MTLGEILVYVMTTSFLIHLFYVTGISALFYLTLFILFCFICEAVKK